ncbi:cytochrome c oxidase assembly protein [Thalassospira sp. TSL5-1]|uniref:cytochrome c oxidase assembly protein n=1 Tax=Thalassospira sp. TSL5-1 TaxID=1544451 RepID=UPI00143BAF0E|nr:cytochrome c oxidase assembly protein [Thalassospira sp. TSL5-1]
MGGFAGYKFALVPGLFDGGSGANPVLLDAQGAMAGADRNNIGANALLAAGPVVDGAAMGRVILARDKTNEKATARDDAAIGAGKIKVSFDGTSDPSMDWDFAPEQAAMMVPLGENRLAFYAAHNRSDRVVTGEAAYSVTPVAAGRYVSKLACFCFDAQRLEPGQNVDMPISFFVDPAITEDPALRGLTEIKLSFAFYAVTAQRDAEARSKTGGG